MPTYLLFASGTKQGGERFDVQSPDTANDVIIKLSLKILTSNKAQVAIWDLGIKE
ncbi:MAG: hypothetical protein RMY16_24715 [Nostoc sp. DedQUE12b]|uniref:hypothetical protein n=1 Tax=Nostoc sp. DedQUE12b TaxID=3075398 RepID=UPI002AD54E34|nr:hypothetical protein [Nostoc sp. DedQUE12b]MDZ8088733.1 hypothetical protein [Nostoc sp. DedQUE12b]